MLVRNHPTGGGNFQGLPKTPLLRRPDGSPEKPKPPGHHGKHGWLGGHIGLESGEHATHMLGAAKGGLVNLKTEAHQATSDAVDAGLHPARQLGENASHVGLSAGMAVVSGALGLASGGLGLYMLRMGARDISQGLAHGNPLHAIEGANSMVVGVRSLAAGVSLAAQLFPHVPGLAGAGHLAHQMVAPLGILHGGVDTALGLHETVTGLRHDNKHQVYSGLLGAGTGVALAVAAAGGGLPALLTAGALLAGKVTHSVYFPHSSPPTEPKKPDGPRSPGP